MFEDGKINTFTYSKDTLRGAVHLPSFEVFSLEPISSEDSLYKIDLDSIVGPDSEIEKYVKAVNTLISNQKEFPQRIVKALWDDFNGVGPLSGMWWNGSIDEVAEDLEEEKLSGPNALYQFMTLSHLRVRPEYSTPSKPMLEFAFHASFEEEHGVGILTDGTSILGSGYMMSVSPYKTY
jgi:hypothetical protein